MRPTRIEVSPGGLPCPAGEGWLRVDRLLGEHGLQADTAEGRIQIQARMEQRRWEGEYVAEWAAFRRGWRLEAEDFAQRLSERLGRRGQKHEAARRM